jgi:Leucine-rich repeat (LRR) protein
MVFVLVFGGALGWIVYRARVQRDAVAAIERAGGDVWYDWQVRDGKVVPNGRPIWPDWLVNRIGVDYFGAVVRVSLVQVATDAELAVAANLSAVEELFLNDSRVFAGTSRASTDGPEHRLEEQEVTDPGLVSITSLKNLKVLHLGNTIIGDDGLRQLKKLTGLTDLGLRYTKTTDAGLAELAGLTSLKRLTLGGTTIGDQGLLHLKGLKNLEMLGLRSTQVTDAGLAHLKDLTSLKTLDLGDTRVTDVGLTHLVGLKQLETLMLMNTGITDAAIEILRTMTSLKSLQLQGTVMSDDVVTTLQQSLPNASIRH